MICKGIETLDDLVDSMHNGILEGLSNAELPEISLIVEITAPLTLTLLEVRESHICPECGTGLVISKLA